MPIIFYKFSSYFRFDSCFIYLRYNPHRQDPFANTENKGNASKTKAGDTATKKSASNRKERDEASSAPVPDAKRKNQKGNVSTTPAAAGTTTTSTIATTTNSSSSSNSKNQSKKNKSPSRTHESDEEKETNTKTNKHKENNKNHLNNVDNSSDNSNSKNSHQKDAKQRNANDSNDKEKDKDKDRDKEKDKENVGAHNQHTGNRSKDKDRTNASHAHDNKSSDAHDRSEASAKLAATSSSRVSSSIQHYDDSDATYFNSNRNKNIKATSHHHDATNKPSAPPLKQPASHGLQSTAATTAAAMAATARDSATKTTFKREEGWKEVSRKSSAQQHPVADVAIKKIIIPTYAISRVIGRAGSNINAIRAATGAHIEVEKQGKSQNDRMITIKGTADATKQASVLIGALVKDPDVDILQMLPKVNTNARSVPPPNVIEKPAPPVVQETKPAATQSQARVTTNSNANRGSVPNEPATFKTPSKIDSSPAVTPAAKPTATSSADHGNPMVLKSTGKSTSAPAAEPFGTFAAKVAADTKSVGGAAVTVGAVATANAPVTAAPEPTNVHLSPKHANTSNPSSTLFVAPAIYTAEKVAPKSTASTASYSTTIISSVADSVPTPPAAPQQKPIRPPVAPIEKPLDTGKSQEPPKPSLETANNQESLQYSKIIARQKAPVQLPVIPSSQSHEYSLFNSSYTSAVTSQWEQSSTFNGARASESYLESDLLPKADASKAPGYRGANLNSPVNSKNQKGNKGDGKPIGELKDMDQKNDSIVAKAAVDFGKSNEAAESLADAIQTAKREALKLDADDLQRGDELTHDKESVIGDMEKSQIAAHISPIGTKIPPPIGTSLNIATSQALNKPTTSVYGNSINDTFTQSMMRQPNMPSLSATTQDILSQQRSLSQSQLRSMSNTMDSMNLDAKAAPSYYDLSMLGLSNANADSMPSYRPRMPSNQMPLSRLNPRASVFSSIQNNNPAGKNANMPMMNQPYGRNDMFSQPTNQSMNANYNPYQKMPPFGNQNAGNAAADRKVYGKRTHCMFEAHTQLFFIAFQ